MHKKLISLVALVCSAAAANAQSSVTIWGIVDATLDHGTGSVSNRTQLTNSGLASSQLGFRGVEDLGGGTTASFWLEAGVNNDNGSGTASNANNQAAAPALGNGQQGLTFNRRSTVSLSGTWGELRLGRDYTPQYRNLAFEPFGNNGIGTGQNANFGNPTSVRASNSIQYLYNVTDTGWGVRRDGAYAQVMYYLGENPSGTATSRDGNGYGLRVGYVTGPLHLAAAVSTTTYLAGDVHVNNVLGTYNLGFATAYAQYSSDRLGLAHARGYLVGLSVPVGVNSIRASYSTYRIDTASDPTAKKLALGYVHNLSKRTSLYATFAHVSNEGSSAVSLAGSVTAAGGSSNGYEFGLKQSF
jgi:predicted porin